MTTVERIIPAHIADDGSVHYTSVMSPSDHSIAVCLMVPDRVIPVVFVPGVMGTNLMDPISQAPVWLVNGTWSVLKDWGSRGPEKRKQTLDPKKTDVYSGGAIPQGTAQSDTELRRRGWGEVGYMSYGTFLPWLENALNDPVRAREGFRSELMKQLVAQSHGVDLLSHDEVAMSYKYQFPVHAVGYNWLQSNAVSANRLDSKIHEFMQHYRSKGFMCNYVIIVTHSMGGLVARYYSEVANKRNNVLGIVHGVMPTTGSATAYKRVKAGTEMPAGLALGSDSAQMTVVFAQAPGPLQLLPSPEYGMAWLKIKDGGQLALLPKMDPYSEIYVKRGAWWSLCDDKLINPLDKRKLTIEQDWVAYEKLINNEVLFFHDALAGPDRNGQYHGNTYAFYGDDAAHSTWGDVVWKRRIAPFYESRGGMPRLDDQLGGSVISGDGKGYVGLQSASDGRPDLAIFDLEPAGDNGDGTVPIRSGQAPGRRIKACVPFPGVDHEGAYKERAQQLFALWAITKIAYTVRYTDMAYKT
jgi:pimeloyl-ACP methyl ester carboxylesterase